MAWYLPYFYLADGITATWSGHPDSLYLPGNWRVSVETFLTVVFAVGVVHLAVSYGILSVTAGSFDRIVGRARQRRETGARAGAGRIGTLHGFIPGIGPRLTFLAPGRTFAGPAA